MPNMTRSKHAIWISFDLGVQGDYEGLYRWLDEHGAEECGDSVAFVRCKYQGDVLESLRKDLESNVQINNRTRVYVIHEQSGKAKGKFLIGGRKRPAWSGYAPKPGREEDSSV